MKRASLLAAVALLLASCASYQKQCFGDGVCRVEKGGQVQWEGPPDKVAKRREAEDKQAQQAAALDKAWAEAPKRPSTEPVRLAIVGPTAATPALRAHASTYRAMIEGAVQGDSRIQLVPASQVKLLGGAESVSTSRGGFDEEKAPRTAVDAGLTQMLRDTGAEVDVVLVVHVAPKKVSGFVSGGGGFGVAEVVNPEFQASLSSIYRFAEQKTSVVGKSTDSLALAGIGKDGKASSGELKGKRNPDSDRPAIQQVGAWVKETVGQRISPDLPSLAAVKEIRAKNPDANPMSPLLKLFQRR